MQRGPLVSTERMTSVIPPVAERAARHTKQLMVLFLK